MLKLSWQDARHALWRKPVFSVIVLVTLWNILLSDYVAKQVQKEGPIRETLSEIRDVNVHLRLRFYQVLTTWKALLQPNFVSVVYIDNDTHWTTLYGDSPTDRKFLAALIDNAIQADPRPRAIALDVQLYAPLNFPPGSDGPERRDANDKLLKAIDDATRQGVPVILATGFYLDHGVAMRIPSIFADGQLPLQGTGRKCPPATCAIFGYINPPDDQRVIPLQKQLYDTYSQQWKNFDSFAFATVKMYEGPQPFVSNNHQVLKALRNPEASDLFGSFTDNYPLILANDLFNAAHTAVDLCSNRIVLIGGNWRDVQGHGDLVDKHLSPIGFIPGILFHASYIESLLQNQFEPEVPAAVGVLIDVIVGLVIYMCFELATGWQKLWVLLLAGGIPVLLAYICLVNFHVYLDFLLPLELYFVHIFYETVRDYLKLKFPRISEAPAGHS